jgi:hypothetical protein
MLRRIVSWHHTLASAKSEARLRQMPILEVIQPKGKKPLYGFGRQDSKKYYVVTSAPKTVSAELVREGVVARQMPLSLLKFPKKKRRVSSLV